MALFGSKQWGVPLWGANQPTLLAGGGNAGGLGSIFPSQIPGLTFTERKTPEFRTLVQSSPDKYETRLPQTRNPIWHFELIYEYIYGAYPSPKNQLAFAPYTDIASFMGFFNGNYGQYGEFLYDDPKDRTASGVLFALWQPNRAYSLFDLAIDPISGHAFTVDTPGTSGSTVPDWSIIASGSGGVTPDGTVVWVDQGYFPDGYPDVPVSLPLWTDAEGNAFSPLQRNAAGLFSEDITDLNGLPTVYANGLLQPESAYVIEGLGLAVPGHSCRGLYLAWLTPPTPPIAARFDFYFRVRMESDSQDFERFMDELWTIGGSSSKNGSGSLKLMSARSVGAIASVPGSGGTFGGAGTPIISTFSASPSSIASGDSSTLAWVVTGADSLSISAGVGTVTGSSVSVSPSSGTTYRLTAMNAAGSTTADVMISVSSGTNPPVIASFTATPSNSALAGAPVTLAWSVSNFTSLSINNGVGTVTGTSIVVNPTATTVYLLTATNATGSATAGAFVLVGVVSGLPAWHDSSHYWGVPINTTDAIYTYLINHPNYFTQDWLVTDMNVENVVYSNPTSVANAATAWNRAYNLLTARNIMLGTYISGTNVELLIYQDRYPFSVCLKDDMPSNAVYLGTFISPTRFAIDPTDATTRDAFHALVAAQWNRFPAIRWRFIDNSCSLQGGPFGPWATQMSDNVGPLNTLAQSMGCRAIFNASILIGLLSSTELSQLIAAIPGGAICLESPWGPHVNPALPQGSAPFGSAAATASAVSQYRAILDAGIGVIMIGASPSTPTQSSSAQLKAWTETWRLPGDHLYLAAPFTSLPDPVVYDLP